MRPTKREMELAKREMELVSEVNFLKIQVEFIKGQANDTTTMFINAAKETLTLAEEYKKENEEMKRLLKLILEETDCLATFRYADKIEKLIGSSENGLS